MSTDPSNRNAAFNSRRGHPVMNPLKAIEEVPQSLIDLFAKLNSKQFALPHTCKRPNSMEMITIEDQKPFLWFDNLSLRVYKFCQTETTIKLELVLIISTTLFTLTPGELPPAGDLVRCMTWKEGAPNYFYEKPDYIFSVSCKTKPPRLLPVRKFIWQIPAGIEQMDVNLLSDKRNFADKVLEIYISKNLSLVEKSIEMDPLVRYNFTFSILEQLCRPPAAQPVTVVKIEQKVTKPSTSGPDLFARRS